MRFVLFLLLVLSCFSLKSQKTEILWKSTVQLEKRKSNMPLYYLESYMDTSQLMYLARIKSSAENSISSINVLYNSILNEAQKMGANSFIFVGYNVADPSLVLDVYFCSDSMLALNKKGIEKNYLYIFPSMENTDETYTFKINGERKKLKTGYFFKYQISNEVTINKGGILGTTLVIREKEDKSNIYYSLSGLGLGSSMPYDGMGIAITTGKFYPVDENIAKILMHILKPE